MSFKDKRDILAAKKTLEEMYLNDDRERQYVMIHGERTEIDANIILKYGSYKVNMTGLDAWHNPVYILEERR